MLRNWPDHARNHRCRFLNEVLSLNAQEFSSQDEAGSSCVLLNEVLSLNAQEFVERKLAADFVVNPQ